jgi:hypothetical protein
VSDVLIYETASSDGSSALDRDIAAAAAIIDYALLIVQIRPYAPPPAAAAAATAATSTAAMWSSSSSALLGSALKRAPAAIVTAAASASASAPAAEVHADSLVTAVSTSLKRSTSVTRIGGTHSSGRATLAVVNSPIHFPKLMQVRLFLPFLARFQ